ncbi:MAG: polyhydroxyalkanoate synthesis repressor PhaR [Rhodobacteraceae bacterium]|nr:polyhydroxyalkanoate synthesis repressor PhaR [Paracoccaceae bacterium]
MEDDEGEVLIKRYASRRLYNTLTSEYVTLQQVAEIVRNGQEVRIEDYRTGHDLTRQHLIQIIAEQESDGTDLLPIEVLFELIRSYSRKNAALYPQFLRSSLEAFHAYQDRFLEGMRPNTTPQQAFGRMWKQNIKLMDSLMGGWMDQGDATTPKPHDPPSEDSSASIESELDAIKQQMAALNERMNRLL